MNAAGISRRNLLVGVGVGAGVGLGLGLGVKALPASAATFDYTSRADFDRFVAAFEASGATGQATDNNENGALAWGQAYLLLGLVRMYEKTKDTGYLDHLIQNIDTVLDQRDQARGVADYRGVSGPVWRAMGNYTAATATLRNAAGEALLQVRTAQPSVGTVAKVQVKAGTGGSFTIVFTPKGAAAITVPNLNFDTASSQYVFRRVYLDAYNPTTRWSIRDVRPDHAVFKGLPVFATTTLQPAPFAFAVHTGQLTYPIASFIRLVYEDPALSAYKAKADAYLAEVDAAIAFHQREYWVNSRGYGSYLWVKESPVPLDGSDQPLNQSNMLGATAAELYRATGSAAYGDRVLQLKAGIRASMAFANNAYSWPYWPSYSAAYAGWAETGYTARDISSFTQSVPAAKQAEDISHGALNLEFMVAAYRTGLPGTFTLTDMQRLATTYTHNIAVGSTGAHSTVAGTGTATAGTLQQIPRWIPAAEWNRNVYTHALAVARAQALQPTTGSLALCYAYCVAGA